MASQNPPPKTPTGGDETITLEYRKLWKTRLSDNRNRLGWICKDDLDCIHQVIGPAAADWEAEHGQIHTNSPGSIDDGHDGLQGAKIVPVTLNLRGENIHSFAGNRALYNNDFTALSQTGLPDGVRPKDLTRWRPRDSHFREKRCYPSRYIVWEDPKSRDDLYALVPKPLEGMSRADCDHCRIHDPDRVADGVEHYDDRPHVDDFREMSAGETAVTPFSLCWFHWWYMWTGELLRPSHIHALELHVGGKLRKRWGISHMRELLRFMKARFPTAEELLEDDLWRGREPGPGSTRGAWLNTVGREVVEELEGSNLSNLQGERVTSTDPHQMAAGGQPASAATADGPNGTRAGGQSTVAPADPDLMILHRIARSYEIKRGIEEVAARTGKVRDQRQVTRQLVLDLPTKASRRRGVPLPGARSFFDRFGQQTRAQDGNRPAVQGNNGDSRLVDGSGASQSATNSAPAPDFPHYGTIGPAGPSRTNEQSTPSRIRASLAFAGFDGKRASQANGPVLSSTEAPVPHPQTNATLAPREDGFLRSPPKEPRLMRIQREMQAEADNSAQFATLP